MTQLEGDLKRELMFSINRNLPLARELGEARADRNRYRGRLAETEADLRELRRRISLGWPHRDDDLIGVVWTDPPEIVRSFLRLQCRVIRHVKIIGPRARARAAQPKGET